MSKFIYEKTLLALEKLDKRDTTFKKIAYKTLYKVYIKSFTKNIYIMYRLREHEEEALSLIYWLSKIIGIFLKSLIYYLNYLKI